MNAKKLIALCLALTVVFSCTAVCAAAEESFTVKASSNIAETVTENYTSRNKSFTVSYCLKTEDGLINGDWYLKYDPEALKLKDGAQVMPKLPSDGYKLNLSWDNGIAYGSFMSESMYDFSSGELSDNVFVTAEFEILDYSKDTEVYLNVFMLSGGRSFTDDEGEAQIEDINFVQLSEPSDVFIAQSDSLILLSKPEPETTEPPTTEPPTTEPPTTEPPTTEPPTTEPPTTEPPTTEPPTTEPLTTEPPTTEPPTTEPPTTEPPTTEPPTTEPLTTEPPTTEPPTTEPPTTEPPTTEPPTTEPPTTEPPVQKLTGDVNGDGKYDIRDAAAIQLYKARLYIGEFDESVADVNGDGVIDVRDAAYIQLDLAKLL